MFQQPTTATPTTLGPEQLFRLAGFALVAALPLQLLGFALHPPGEDVQHVASGAYGPAHTILFWSWVLAMLGLPALYARQAAGAGRLGLVGFVASMASIGYHLYLTLYEAFAVPAMAGEPAARALVGPDGPLGHGAGALGPVAPLLLLGLPLLGIATVRAKVFPPLAGWLQVAAVPTFLAVMMGLGVVLGGAVGPEGETWLGGMLPIASLYWVLFAGYAVAGAAMVRPSTARAADPTAGIDRSAAVATNPAS